MPRSGIIGRLSSIFSIFPPNVIYYKTGQENPLPPSLSLFYALSDATFSLFGRSTRSYPYSGSSSPFTTFSVILHVLIDLEDAVKALWKINIYAESGMGCTGPIIRVSDANLAKAEEELKKAGYIN